MSDQEKITVTRDGNAVRVCRGEDVIEPDTEARALAVKLWAGLAKHEPNAPLRPDEQGWPWDAITENFAELDRLSAALEGTAKTIREANHSFSSFQWPPWGNAPWHCRLQGKG